MRSNIDKAINLLSNDLKNNDQNIKEICNLFYSKPDFDTFGDLSM